MVIIPEEAELLIPLVYDATTPLTHLLTYAAPVTRKMLHFNGLQYYAMPGLPTGWEAPKWLKIELGIFAGRLYFEYSEYSDLCKYLGLREATANLAETTDTTVAPAKLYKTEGSADDAADEAEMDMRAQRTQNFTTKPLTFLQEWLGLRRKGQDFAHTPMGHLCQGKPLTASHPFFTRLENDSILKSDAADVRDRQGMERNVDVYSIDDGSKSDDEVRDDDFDCDSEEDKNGMFHESDLCKE